MKLAVIGSRNIRNEQWITHILDAYRLQGLTEIVSGGAKGVDTIAEEYACKHGIAMSVIPADWDRYGKSAGYRRNVDIWNYCDEGVAIWDGKSKGTEHSFTLATQQKKTLLVFTDGKLVKHIIRGQNAPLEI